MIWSSDICIQSPRPWRLNANVATPDHNVPTIRGDSFKAESIEDEISKIQVMELDKNCNEFKILQFDIESKEQGIVHVMGRRIGREGHTCVRLVPCFCSN